MFKATGVITGKTYAKGTKADCFRTLQKHYPYVTEDLEHYHKEQKVRMLYKEPISIIRV